MSSSRLRNIDANITSKEIVNKQMFKWDELYDCNMQAANIENKWVGNIE